MIRLLSKDEKRAVEELVVELRKTTSSLIESRLASEVGEKRAKETMLRINDLVDKGLNEAEVLSAIQGNLDVVALWPAVAVAALAATQTSCVGILKEA